MLGAGVARRVGEAFLGDAVDGEALLGRERGRLGAEPVAHAQAAALLDARGERDQGAAQPALLERSGAQAAGDLAQVLDALLGGELGLREGVLELGGDASGEAVELQADAGGDLAELVMELAGESAPLAFLGGEGAATAREAFAFEPVEHVLKARARSATSATGRSMVILRPG